jgi:hypothetical protein
MSDIEHLRERVTYDPVTGELRWVKSAALASFPDARACRSWHSQKAGKLITSSKYGYVRVGLNIEGRVRYFLGHRVAWALTTGAWPEHDVDHIDRNRSNNRWANLRAATTMHNAWNRGLLPTNTSGEIGVRWCGRDNRWKAEITTNWKRKHLGSFKIREDAVRARRAAEVAQRGEFAVQGV